MSRIRVAALACIIVCLFTTPSSADSWAAAQPMAALSPNGERLVRIEPGGDGAAKRAQATYYRRDPVSDTYQRYQKVALRNRVSPVDVFLNDEGVLATFDNWFTVGYGPVVVIVNPQGKVVKSYGLEHLYSKEKITEIPHSVSSRWWRCATHEVQMTGDSVIVVDTFGGRFTFQLSDGSFDYVANDGQCS